MNLFSLRVLSPALLLFAAACGGGGGGGGGDLVPESDQIPVSMQVSRPSGLGAAGLMDGTWRVVDVQIVDDARNSNVDVDQAWFALDEDVRFENGRVADDEDETSTETHTSNTSSTPAVLEYFANRSEAGATVVGFGVSFGGPEDPNRGAVRFGAVIGTVAAGRATGVVVQQFSFPEAAYALVNHFMVTRVTLERLVP